MCLTWSRAHRGARNADGLTEIRWRVTHWREVSDFAHAATHICYFLRDRDRRARYFLEGILSMLKTIRGSIAAIVSVAVVAATLLLVPTATAHADPVACHPNSTWTVVKSPRRHKVITHASMRENFTGSKITRTTKAHHRQTVAARVRGAASLSAEARGRIFKVFRVKTRNKFHVSVKARGSRTTSRSVSVTHTMRPGDRYVFFKGVYKVRSRWNLRQCNSRGTGSTVVKSGNAMSYVLGTRGGVGCKKNPPRRSMSHKAKRVYC